MTMCKYRERCFLGIFVIKSSRFVNYSSFVLCAAPDQNISGLSMAKAIKPQIATDSIVFPSKVSFSQGSLVFSSCISSFSDWGSTTSIFSSSGNNVDPDATCCNKSNCNCNSSSNILCFINSSSVLPANVFLNTNDCTRSL